MPFSVLSFEALSLGKATDFAPFLDGQDPLTKLVDSPGPGVPYRLDTSPLHGSQQKPKIDVENSCFSQEGIYKLIINEGFSISMLLRVGYGSTLSTSQHGFFDTKSELTFVGPNGCPAD